MKKLPAMPQMASFNELGIMSVMSGIQYAIEHLDQLLDDLKNKLETQREIAKHDELHATAHKAMRKGLPPDMRADGLGLMSLAIEEPDVREKKKKETHKRNKNGAPDVPMEVNGMMTRYGIAKEVGVTPSGVWFRMNKAGIKGKKIKHPTKPGSFLIVFSEAQTKKAIRLFRPPKNKGGARSPNHPSNADHPGHAAWLQKMSEAARKSYEVRRQKKAEEAQAA